MFGVRAGTEGAKHVGKRFTRSNRPVRSPRKGRLGFFGHPRPAQGNHGVRLGTKHGQRVFEVLCGVVRELTQRLCGDHPPLACKFTYRGFGIAPRRVPLTDHQQRALGVAHKIRDLERHWLNRRRLNSQGASSEWRNSFVERLCQRNIEVNRAVLQRLKGLVDDRGVPLERGLAVEQALAHEVVVKNPRLPNTLPVPVVDEGCGAVGGNHEQRYLLVKSFRHGGTVVEGGGSTRTHRKGWRTGRDGCAEGPVGRRALVQHYLAA